jgi:hypothetical protein
MPDLIELLGGAVDPPTTLDLEALGRRRARRHRRRRILQAATVVGVVLLAAGSLVAVRSGAHDGNDVEMPPIGDPDRPTTTDPDSPETTEAPTTTTTTTGARQGAPNPTGTGGGNPLDPVDDGGSDTGDAGDAGAAGASTTTTTTAAERTLPECLFGDFVVTPSSEAASDQQVIDPGFSLAWGEGPCSVETYMTVTLYASTGEVLAVDHNPLTPGLSGTVGAGDGPQHNTLVLSGCAPNTDPGERGEVTVSIEVAGYAYGRSTVTASRCVDPQQGLTFSALA